MYFHLKTLKLVLSGPNELSIIDVELIPYIFGAQGLPKGPSKIYSYVNTIFAYFPVLLVWDGRRFITTKGDEINSLTSVRDLRLHAQLRKPWNNAFRSTALVDYEDMLVNRAAQLITHLQKQCDDGVYLVDLANLISFFSSVYPFVYNPDTISMLIVWCQFRFYG